MRDDFLLAIPVFNEEGYVDRVLDEARLYAMNILIVDDGSTDRTAQRLRAQPAIHVITHAENRGYGQSLVSAFAFARRNKFAWLITMDCDEQHEASQIPHFLDEIDEDRADIISGTRYPQGHDFGLNAPADRRAINRRITAMLNQRLMRPPNPKLTDAFCGFKAYRVASLEHFAITVPGYAMPMQFWVQAVRANLRIREIPVSLIYKDHSRHFGGMLDDPDIRLAHYVNVFESEMRRTDRTNRLPSKTTQPCRPSCAG